MIETIIDGRVNEEDINKNINILIEIIKNRKKTFLIIGVISENNGVIENFAINNCSQMEALFFTMKIYKTANKMMNIIENIKNKG